MIQVHGKGANGAFSEILPNENCFERAEFLASDNTLFFCRAVFIFALWPACLLSAECSGAGW